MKKLSYILFTLLIFGFILSLFLIDRVNSINGKTVVKVTETRFDCGGRIIGDCKDIIVKGYKLFVSSTQSNEINDKIYVGETTGVITEYLSDLDTRLSDAEKDTTFIENSSKRDIINRFKNTKQTVYSDVSNGIVACYDFDYGMTDLSGKGNDGVGTIVTPATVNKGISDNGYEYHGSGYIDLGTNVTSTDYTISLWFQLDTRDIGSTTTLMSRSDIIDDAYDYDLIIGDFNKIHLVRSDGIGNYTEIVTTLAYTDLTKFYHLVATYNSITGDAEIYIDNVLAGSGNMLLNVPFVSTKHTYLGKTILGPWGDDWIFHGIIDAVVYFDRVINITERTTLYNGGYSIKCS